MSSRKTAGNRFRGLELSAEDRVALKAMGRQRVSARVWRRVRLLQLLDEDWTMADAASAVGTYPREVRRVGWRYLKGGLAEAPADRPQFPERSLSGLARAPPATQHDFTD